MNQQAITVLDRPKTQKLHSPDNVIGFTLPQYVNPVRTSQVIPISFSRPVDTIGRVIITTSSNDLTPVNLELWIFRQEPPAQEDNTPFVPTEKELASVIKVVTFDFFKGSPSRVFQSREESMPAPLASVLWAVLVARNSFTPVSDERFIVSVLGVGPG